MICTMCMHGVTVGYNGAWKCVCGEVNCRHAVGICSHCGLTLRKLTEAGMVDRDGHPLTMADMTEPQLELVMKNLACRTEAALPPGPSPNGKMLFTLLVFDEPQGGQYIGNCDRASIIQALRNTADRLEVRQDVPR